VCAFVNSRSPPRRLPPHFPQCLLTFQTHDANSNAVVCAPRRVPPNPPWGVAGGVAQRRPWRGPPAAAGLTFALPPHPRLPPMGRGWGRPPNAYTRSPAGSKSSKIIITIPNPPPPLDFPAGEVASVIRQAARLRETKELQESDLPVARCTAVRRQPRNRRTGPPVHGPCNQFTSLKRTPFLFLKIEIFPCPRAVREHAAPRPIF